ncbi:hypothetical protein Arth_3016 [Arthrobacter sp. FB24]|uniref:hypothetical protein n=1 Tax=Arthrobacter sp. (strain FB24) TaxID=290399 RepID=UPI000052723C|nr:hypothetical protein [Arthrobacter sp. FB24]ABK04395.1 hypothetical protein Arth_3016 [Arthrobacter sp. FB24]
MPVQFELPTTLLLGPLAAAVVIYLILRWVVWEPRMGASPETVSQHALWVGVIGWMTSSLQGAMNIGIIPSGRTTSPAIGPFLVTPDTIIPALAWPILGTIGVHALGQLSYPRPRGPRRKASLQVRKIRDFLPRPLAWTTLAIFTGAAGFTAWTATLPGFAAIAYGSVREDPQGYRTIGGDGRIPGSELAGWLGAALVALAACTWLVLLLICRRRQLEQLTDHDNSILRTIAMNRLLRTVSTMASGLAVIAGNYVARPDPAAGSTSWTNFAAFAGMAVLLAMLLWAPPKLTGTATAAGLRNAKPGHFGAGPHPASKLVVSVGAGLGVAAALPVLAGAFLVPAIIAAGPSGPAVFITLVAGLVLVVLAAGELLLQRNYTSPDEPRTWPRQPVGAALLTTLILALLVLVTTLVVSAAGNTLLGRDGGWIPAALLSTAGVLLALPALLATRLRRGIPAAPPGLDAALRAITLHRMARTLSAMFMAQAAMVLLMNSQAWAAVFGVAFLPSIPWWPASLAGTILACAAVATAVIPVRTFAGSRSRPAPLPRRDHVT